MAQSISLDTNSPSGGNDTAAVLARRFAQLQAMYRMTAAVSRATSLADIYDNALACLEAAIGAHRTSILLFDLDGVMRFKAWHGLSSEYRAAVEGHSPWKPGEKNPQSITIADLRTADGLDALLPAIEREGIRSLAFVPLISQGTLLGKFMLYFDQPHEFSGEELQLAETIANQIAYAISRQKGEDDLKAANAAKSAFLATMSHELRTPLNAILGYSDLLNVGVSGRLNETQVAHVDRIRASARHLINLIEEILTFSRAEAGKETVTLSAIELVSFVTETASMVEPIAQAKALELQVQLKEPLDTMQTDAGKLRQVLLNLLSNAVKFTDRGHVVLAAERTLTGVRFTVRDTGRGIAPEHQRRIFEPFYQADQGPTRRACGTGLGLTVTAQLVELLGGRITLVSQPGEGATFTVELPDNGLTD